MSGLANGHGPVHERVAVPGAVVERFHRPRTAAEVGQIIEEASRQETGLLIAGGRTRLHWANVARNISLGLSLRELSGIDVFEPEEGVLHAAAGTSIREVQKAARSEGWELALDPPGANSTVGGTIASAAVGPRAQCFGRVANSILGLDVVGADGIQSKCGGRVVKNVTGYDLAKLYCGSFGSLGVITGAWLRLRPLPTIRESFVAGSEAGHDDFDTCRSICQRTSVRAVVWSQESAEGKAEILVELGGSSEEVSRDREWIASVMKIDRVPLERVDELRDARARTDGDPIAIRARVVESRCEEVKSQILGLGLRVCVDPGLGTIHARGRLDSAEGLFTIRQKTREAGGLAIFENLPDAWREDIDVFDDPGDGSSVIAVLKHRFDPSGILNPGRFAGRI